MELNTIERLSGAVATTTAGSTLQVCDAVLAEIHNSGILDNTDNRTLGIYVVSPNAGMHDAVAFWKLALEQGPGFMSPQQFPWTLANAPAAYIARQLQAHGPNVTIVGDWIHSLMPTVRNDICLQKCHHALVIYISFSDRQHGYFIVFAVSSGQTDR